MRPFSLSHVKTSLASALRFDLLVFFDVHRHPKQRSERLSVSYPKHQPLWYLGRAILINRQMLGENSWKMPDLSTNYAENGVFVTHLD